MKGQRIMKIVGLLVVIAAVVMVVLYFTGVLGPKKAGVVAGGNNAPGYHPGTQRSNIGGHGGVEKHILG